MKKIFSVMCVLAITVAVFAQDKKQDKQQKKDDGWREKLRAEQVAFITNELDLTEAEAQAFWPVYNDVQNSRREAFKNQAEAMKALKKSSDDKEAATLLDKYLDAKKEVEKIDNESIARYRKVLPTQKVGKLILAEEKFRHQQIGKLGKGGPGPGFDGPGKDDSRRKKPQEMNEPSSI